MKIIQPVLIVLVVYLIFTVFLLRYFQGDISCLVHAGRNFTNPAGAPRGLCVDQGDGYDGQFNYRFALDPFSNQPVLHGISIDRPAYRHQRIFYSLLAWAITGGNSAFIPVVLVLINLVSACGLTALAAKYAIEQGRGSHWSLALGLYPGFLLSYALDLGHTLEILLLFGAFLLVKKNDGWAVFLLICAVLTRETAVLFGVALSIAAFIQRWRRWVLYLLPAGCVCCLAGFFTLVLARRARPDPGGEPGPAPGRLFGRLQFRLEQRGSIRHTLIDRGCGLCRVGFFRAVADTDPTLYQDRLAALHSHGADDVG